MVKGQKTGVGTPIRLDRKVAMSPSVQHGVTPDYVPNERTISSDKNISTASPLDNREEAVWFLMRAAYGQENKVKDFLEAKGIEVFLPCHKKAYERNGKRVHMLQSLIPNFLFVKSTEAEMKKYIGKGDLSFFHHSYVPNIDATGKTIGRKGIKPLVIPKKQMEAFIKWHYIDDDGKLFIPDDSMPLSMNERVCIIDGKFAGLEGHVFRIKGQSRVGIVVEGVGTVFTAYIPKACLKKY